MIVWPHRTSFDQNQAVRALWALRLDTREVNVDGTNTGELLLGQHVELFA